MTPPSPVRRAPNRIEWLLAALAIGLVAWGWAWAHERHLPRVERAWFEWANGLPDALRFGLWPPMQLGNGLVILIAPVVAAVWWRRTRPPLAIFAATFAAWLGARVVKQAVERGRPAAFLDDVAFRGHAPDGFGFVSGHTAVAFALATAVRPYLSPRGQVVAFALAAVVGFARMFFGAHLPADVVGGAGLGILCGLLATVLVGVDERPTRGST